MARATQAPPPPSPGYATWSRDPAVSLFAVLPLWLLYEGLRLLLAPGERNGAEALVAHSLRALGPQAVPMIRVIFGLTAALHGRIDVVDGVVQQRNFPDYPLLTLARSPRIETHLVDSEGPPRGVGEPGLPPVAPALANALFALTGQRLRDLPLSLP